MDYCYHCMAEIKNPENRFCPECGQEHNVHYSQSFEIPAGNYLCNKRYLVGESLGVGGFGITYIGFDVKINKKIVIKETFYSGLFRRNSQDKTLSDPLRVEYDNNIISLEEIMSKTQKECFCLSKAESFNNIVKVYDWFAENNTAYIITEYINGDTLYDRVSKAGAYNWEELYSKFKPLLQSLSQIHNMDLLHRDIKPQNIMLRKVFKSREDFVIIDFGLARSNRAKTLATAAVAFTPGYSPFEQRTLSRKDGTYTDVYALAATMYYALTGETPNDEIVSNVHENFPLLKSLKSSGKITEQVYKAFVSALQPNYKNRCQTINEFICLLDDKGYSPYKYEIERKTTSVADSISTQYASNTDLYEDNLFANVNPPIRSRSNYDLPQNAPRQDYINSYYPSQQKQISSVQAPTKSKGKKHNFPAFFLIFLCIVGLTASIVTLLDIMDIISVSDYIPTSNFDTYTESDTDTVMVMVPNLLEMNKINAKDSLEDKGLHCSITLQPTDNYEEDYVVSQYPMPGMEVKMGETVDIYVSTSVKDTAEKLSNVDIPDVVNEKYYNAAQDLVELGFEIAWDTYYTEDMESNIITKQEPKAGTNAKYGSTITLYVSQKIDLNDYVEIGDYIGQNIDQVKPQLEKIGFRVTYSTNSSSKEADGTILKQNFEANKQYKKGITLNFVVAKSLDSISSKTASKRSNNLTRSKVSVLRVMSTVPVEGNSDNQTLT